MIHAIYFTFNRKIYNIEGIVIILEYFHILLCFELMVDSGYGQFCYVMTVILKHNCLLYHTNLAKVMVSVVTKSHIEQGLLLTSNALTYMHLLKKDLVGEYTLGQYGQIWAKWRDRTVPLLICEL